MHLAQVFQKCGPVVGFNNIKQRDTMGYLIILIIHILIHTKLFQMSIFIKYVWHIIVYLFLKNVQSNSNRKLGITFA